jgi:thiosulfate dehydrogenase (quinone) large subunit
MQASNQSMLFKNPPVIQSLFSNPSWAWLWFIARLYLGYTWLSSGWGKLSNPAWMQSGSALQGFWERAIAIPDAPARPLIAFNWYRTFLQALLESEAYVWFAKLLVYGEVLVGIGLILGALTGVAAFFGAFMNWNFMMAGTASTNPVLFILAVLLLVAWRKAGWWGVDRWLLPILGTPWQPGKVFTTRPQEMLPQEVCACGETCACVGGHA